MTLTRDRLLPGDELHRDQELRSADGRFRLLMQSDGNLVEYYAMVAGPALWASGTAGRGTFAALQGDGNFVVNVRDGEPFASGTAGRPARELILQDDGNLVMYFTDGSDPWGTGVPDPPPAPPAPIVPRLRRDGQRLVTPDGTQQFLAGITAFTILQAWLDGGEAAVAPFVDYMDATGLDVARGLGMYHGGIGRFIPADYGVRWFTGLDGLLGYLQGRGRRLKLDVFCDCEPPSNGYPPAPNPLTQVDQQPFWRHVCEVARAHPNAWIAPGNEGNADGSKNGWRQTDFTVQPSGVLCDRGSVLDDDGSPPRPPWDTGSCHPGRIEFERKFKELWDNRTGNNTPQEALACPLGVDEGIGIGEADAEGKTTADPERCWDFAAGVRMFGDFLILHTRCSISALAPPAPGSRTDRCVRASVDAVRAVEGWWTTRHYTRGGLVDCPLAHDDSLALRTYALLNGPQAIALAVSPTVNWRAFGVNNWRIRYQAGPRGNLVYLER